MIRYGGEQCIYHCMTGEVAQLSGDGPFSLLYDGNGDAVITSPSSPATAASSMFNLTVFQHEGRFFTEHAETEVQAWLCSALHKHTLAYDSFTGPGGYAVQWKLYVLDIHGRGARYFSS